MLELPVPAAPQAAHRALTGSSKIALRGVTVAYADRAVPALNHVSLEIAPGEHVALVGETGAGKSTVAALLLRFIEPQGGEITVDGVDISQLSPDEWRAQVAYVPQAPYLINASVADNIRLGRPEASMDEVVAATTAARAADFIRGLPRGYDTVIGERGSRLSGGQAQRIAVARAFLVDAPLIILDEATANLDPETDAEIQVALAELLRGRSALIIAHRLGAVKNADKILVLAAGRVVERGTHQALLALGGTYARMAAAGGQPVSPPTGASRPEASFESLSVSPAVHGLSRSELDSLAGLADPVAAAPLSPGPSHLRGPLAGLLPFLAPYTSWIALSVLLGVLTIGSSIGLLSVSAWIISAAALQPSIAVLQVAIVGVRFFGIARGVFRYLERLASHQVTFRVLAAIRVWFYAAIEPYAPARLSRYQSGDLLARVMSDVGMLENFYVRAVSPPLVAAFIALLTGVILAAFHPSLVLPVLALQAVAGIALPLLTLRLGRRPGRALTEGRGQLNQSLVDLLQGLPDLLAFRATGRQVGRVQDEGAAVSAGAASMSVISSGANAGGLVLMWLAAVAILAAATPLVRTGQLTGVSLAVLALLTLASFEAVLPLPVASQYLSASAAAARRLFAVAGKLPSRQDVAACMHFEPPVEAVSAVPQNDTTPPGIAFSNVSLRYAPGEPPALDHVSLAVPAGRLLTVVGPSGAGKSTVANALLRFWDYQSGTITLGGRELMSIEGEQIRAAIGVVSQQTYLFNASIRTNLLLARPEATQAEIEAAARAAQVHDFIASLPQGYDTRVGEGGHKLSGGERQRLAIARALLKDAPVLILDEPAASLDAGTEASLWAALAPLLTRRHDPADHPPARRDRGRRADRGDGPRASGRNGRSRRTAGGRGPV